MAKLTRRPLSEDLLRWPPSAATQRCPYDLCEALKRTEPVTVKPPGSRAEVADAPIDRVIDEEEWAFRPA